MNLHNHPCWKNACILSGLEQGHMAAASGLISFAQGTVSNRVIDTAGIREAMQCVAKASGTELFRQNAPEGYLPLRELLAERMRAKGIPVDASALVLTSNLQHTLMTIAAAVLAPGDRVLVETPSPPSSVDTLTRAGAHVVPVPVDRDGVMLDQLEFALARHRPALLCITPNFANPTGFVTSLRKRKQILQLAVAYDCFVLEDDGYAELYFHESPPPPLISLANDVERRQVIYASSLESLFPQTLRLGWFVADASLLRHATRRFRSADFASHLTQLVAYHYLNTGRFEVALGRIRRHYHAKAAAMLRILRRELRDLIVDTNPLQGGMFAWGSLPDCDTAKLLDQSAPRGVIFAPGALFYPEHVVSQKIRLSFGGTGNDQMTEGIRRIARTMTESIDTRLVTLQQR
ncbi:PLP-dependent aminotransferase family protein [Paraburkholderia sp. J12]|uniref:aminotransferase-like domain-containing protein n=1 Tax=Paraburkholderia sp. J12 TaxID=2805432 RepID=UPI002ABD43E5|nr:PLP-dependent aminotransferase family protein [Paraburkholderia sp. J12]